MDEEVKEAIYRALYRWQYNGDSDEALASILALVVAERDALKEDAIKHRPTQCHEATGYLTRCECGWKSTAHRTNWQVGEPDDIEQGIEEWKAHVRSLTPRIKALVAKARQSASSQPKGGCDD